MGGAKRTLLGRVNGQTSTFSLLMVVLKGVKNSSCRFSLECGPYSSPAESRQVLATESTGPTQSAPMRAKILEMPGTSPAPKIIRAPVLTASASTASVG